jgi:hypothetical protein
VDGERAAGEDQGDGAKNDDPTRGGVDSWKDVERQRVLGLTFDIISATMSYTHSSSLPVQFFDPKIHW